jgi:hypothetical protein
VFGNAPAGFEALLNTARRETVVDGARGTMGVVLEYMAHGDGATSACNERGCGLPPDNPRPQ